jgi:large subunit ribosomal protein L10
MEVLSGPTSLMLCEASSEPAKLIRKFRKDAAKERPILKAAFVGEAIFIGDEQLEVIANMKSKEELIGDIIGLLQSPAKNVISALQSAQHKLAGIVQTLGEREEA